jgi:hypothetical protein
LLVLGKCDCNAANFFAGETGYVTLFNVYTEDLFGNYLTQVGTNEVLFNQLYLGTGGWTNPPIGNPSQSTLTTTKWNSQYTFPDYYWICSSNPSSLTPPPTSSRCCGAEVFSETQNYYIGNSTTNGDGLCTQANAVELNTNNGAQSNTQPPAYPEAVCANKTALNGKP